MRGSVVLAGAILGAVSLVGVPAQASSAPDPYSGGIETECTIKVPKVVKPGERVVIKVAVHANTPAPPTGEVRVAITSEPGGDLVWDHTVNYTGGTKKIVGPVLAVSRYSATAQFRSADGTYARCRASGAFRVGVLGANDNDDDGSPDDGAGGLLPDTGGPAMLWLLLGAALVGGGAGTVVYARRRTTPSTA